MDNNILEARIEYSAGKLKRITVLVDFTPSGLKPYSDVRAIFATTKYTGGGYMQLPPDATISENLLDGVASTGMETVDRDEIFPNWKKKYRNALT